LSNETKKVISLIKEAIYKKEITIINLYIPNIMKHTLKDLKAHIDSNTVVVGDINNPLSPIHWSSRQKINKEILELNDTIDQMDLTDVYRIFHPATAQYTFFSAAHGTFSKIDYILLHKANLNKYKKIEITPCILSDHNAIKLELNNKISSRKYENNWRPNNTLGHRRNKRGNQKVPRIYKNENTTYQNLWDTAKAVLKRKVYSHECIY
jgi:hypothetical protein